MRTKKIVSVSIATVLFVGGFLFSACGGDNPAAAGKKAGKETCDCMKLPDTEKQMDCFMKITEKYKKWDNNEEFAKAFREASQNCK